MLLERKLLIVEMPIGITDCHISHAFETEFKGPVKSWQSKDCCYVV